MEPVYEAFAPLMPFLSVLFAFIIPGIVSITHRVKTDALPSAPSWAWWAVSVLLGVIAAFGEGYLFMRMGLAVPDTLSTGIFGMLAGLAASGLVDLSKMSAGTKR